MSAPSRLGCPKHVRGSAEPEGDVRSLLRRLAAALGVGSCAAAVLTACGAPEAGPAAKAYLSAWSSGTLAAAAEQTDAPPAAAAALAATRRDLHAERITATLDSVDAHGRAATAAFTAHVDIRGLATWTYHGRLQLTRPHDKWVVHWTPTDIHPALTADTHLADIRQLPPRAALLDRRGRPLFAPREVVHIGIEPARLRGHSATVDTVARVVGVHDVAS